MKAIQLFTVIFLLWAGSVSAQDSKAAKPIKPAAAAAKTQTTNSMPRNRYFVQIPHSSDQCKDVMNEMKGKGDPFLRRFSFGCMHGNHTAYAFYDAVSEESVRKGLPVELQKSAKIEKVDILNISQIEQMHGGMK